MDFRGRVTLPMIGNYLIHAASSHAGERGFGFNDMSERHTAWVLSRLAIEMKEYPTAFDKINLYTWIDEVGRLFTSRCFELADEAKRSRKQEVSRCEAIIRDSISRYFPDSALYDQ